VRRAERFIIDNAGTSIAVSDVADHRGISLRSLQASFRQWRETTPTAFLRRARLRPCGCRGGAGRWPQDRCGARDDYGRWPPGNGVVI
jgi:hypothetical protein